MIFISLSCFVKFYLSYQIFITIIKHKVNFEYKHSIGELDRFFIEKANLNCRKRLFHIKYFPSLFFTNLLQITSEILKLIFQAIQ